MSTLRPSSPLSQRSRSRCQNAPCFQRPHDLHVVQSDDARITSWECEDDGLRSGGLNGCRGACALGCLNSINKASHNSSWSTSLMAEEWKPVTRTQAPEPLRAEAQFLPYPGTHPCFATIHTSVVREMPSLNEWRKPYRSVSWMQWEWSLIQPPPGTHSSDLPWRPECKGIALQWVARIVRAPSLGNGVPRYFTVQTSGTSTILTMATGLTEVILLETCASEW